MPLLRLSGRASCPAPDAREYLQRYLLEHADGDCAVLALRPVLRFSALPDLTLVHDCVVSLRLAGTGPASARAAVTWCLAGDDDAMRFDGTLAIAALRDGSGCSVLLRERYRAPAPATVPDLERTIGRCIAESTGRDVLGRVTDYLAASYRSAQAARRNRRLAQR